MYQTIVFAVTFLVPIIGAWILKINTALVFMGLCLGVMVNQFVFSDIIRYHNKLEFLPNRFTLNDWHLAVIFAPAVLIFVFSIRSIHGKLQIINLINGIATGLFAVILLELFVTPTRVIAIHSIDLLQRVNNVRIPIILTGSALSLGLLILTSTKLFSGSHGSHKHHS